MSKKLHLRLLLLFSLIFLIVLPTYAEIIKIATWNIHRFSENTAPDREDDFRLVLEQLDLDILIVQEMYETGVDMFLENIMNYSSPGTYKKAEFKQGFNTGNALFYKDSLIACSHHYEIEVPDYVYEEKTYEFREISEYVLEIKEGPNKGTYFRIYSVHFRSGDDKDIKALRAHEAQTLRSYLNNYLDNHQSNNLFLVCGDFNMQSSEETAFGNLTGNQADNDGKVNDPIDKSGKWNNEEEFAKIHTQATRKIKNGLNYGGLDDRFDMILLSSEFDTSDKLRYKEESYAAYGNDGKHLDVAITDPPEIEPGSEIAEALWEASDHLPVIESLDEIILAEATYESILSMVEPSTGLPHDRFDASLFDIMPQFAVERTIPYTKKATGASLESWRCTDSICLHTGKYGLKIEYEMPSGTWGSYNMEPHSFDVSKAAYLQAWVKGIQGDEQFEFVLWSDCEDSFPGRPDSALISVSQTWELKRIPLEDFKPFVDLSSLCRLSIGFNDAIHPGGTIFLDEIAFVDTEGNRIHIPLDEETNVTNIGLYIASVLAALDLGLENYNDVINNLSTTLTSIENLQKWHGFPQTHNHVVSLSPSKGDTCISTVDLGNLAAGLIVLRQRVPELSSRASVLLNAMEWDWLYDEIIGLPYGCRYPDGSSSDWHYDWLCADSRLAHFIGIGTEKIPPDSWNNLNRQKEQSRCTNLWHFEPGWDGGGLFMSFLPSIFLYEAKSEIETSADNFVKDQICYYQQIGAPAWGWSAIALPPYGEEYCGYGCVRDDILVPHASILAANYVSSSELITNLRAFEALGAREKVTDGNEELDFGFRASVMWQTGEVASVYLVLDQSMSFLSLVNRVINGRIRKLFCQDDITLRAIDLIPDYSHLPFISLSTSALNFGATTSGDKTSDQQFRISNSGGGSLDWSVTDDKDWLTYDPVTGEESGVVTVSVNSSGLSEGAHNATLSFSSTDASNSPQTIAVTLTVKDLSDCDLPFGSFDTPIDSTSGITGAIPVTGWVLDDIGIESVKIYRDPIDGEQIEDIIYIGDAIFVEGARPDVETAYPSYPLNYQAGWGYMMLTNFLPGQGNGTYRIHAYATDKDGHTVSLGTKTITCDNANAVKPFGAIDTPTQGGEASGLFWNSGWALTPMPNSIPTDGSTINVWVDGVKLGNPAYNQYRIDIATLFPGYANTDGAVGAYLLDTTEYDNGVHTIAWSVKDNAGNSDGIGSRFFTIANAGGSAQTEIQSYKENLRLSISFDSILNMPVNFDPIKHKRGYREDIEPMIAKPDEYGKTILEIREVERIEIELGKGVLTGYIVIGDQLKPLPIGSTLDTEKGIFAWMPGPGFIGKYDLVFIKEDEFGMQRRISLKIKIKPKFSIER